MKSTFIASALIALTMASSGSAFAQHRDRDYDRDRRGGYSQHDDRRDNDRRDGRDYRNHDRNDRYYDARSFRRDDHRGGGPRHDLRRGQRLDHEYRGSRYVVTDWRARHLSAPPRGHHWVRAGNDYVLAAIATGIIAQVLLSN